MSVSIADLVAQIMADPPPKKKYYVEGTLCPRCLTRDKKLITNSTRYHTYCTECTAEYMREYRNKRGI
jgi:Zn ribbon nucleic-acid-binding protein